jgi:hypothetical protein
MAMVKSKLKKFGFFTPIAFYSSGLETDISYRNLKTFFSDLWTLECQVKIHNWRSENLLPNVRHAGPAGSGCCRVTRDNCLIQKRMGTSLAFIY